MVKRSVITPVGEIGTELCSICSGINIDRFDDKRLTFVPANRVAEPLFEFGRTSISSGSAALANVGTMRASCGHFYRNHHMIIGLNKLIGAVIQRAHHAWSSRVAEAN